MGCRSMINGKKWLRLQRSYNFCRPGTGKVALAATRARFWWPQGMQGPWPLVPGPWSWPE